MYLLLVIAGDDKGEKHHAVCIVVMGLPSRSNIVPG